MKTSSTFSLSGFSEAVFVVNDIEKSIAFYCDVVGWEIVTDISIDDMTSFWHLDEQAVVQSCVIQAPNSQSGAIRLVQISGMKQRYIRANSQIWDTGAIFDINTRVKNIHAIARKLNNYQWFGINEPVEMQFGPFKVYEWLAKSHDGITHALIERIVPPLEPSDAMNNQTALFSEIINASLIVKDHEKEKLFLTDVLNFTVLIHQEDTFDNESSNVFGMPYELVAKTPHVLTLLSADGTRNGTVELASFPELTGNDFSQNNQTHNLGITTLRFKVNGMKAFRKHLSKQDVEVDYGGHFNMSPYGNVSLIAVYSPSGNRFEFFEMLSDSVESIDKKNI